jgi:Ni/Co efflux regulator RcnB
MRKLSLYILAASVVFVSAPAFAQGARPGPGPRPPAGHSWRGGGTVGMPAHRPNVQVRHFGGRFGHPGRNFRHHRMNRGFVIHPFWFGSQFHINNWQMYGFGNPGDGRWVRYYDDAYLIGRDGRVRDYRYGMDWNRYGEDWDMDDGIPAYRGRGDYGRDDEDDEWAERDDDEGHGEHRGGHQEGHRMGGHMMGGSGYGAGYGGYYGYGAYAYPIVIETVTTTGGGYSEEIVEEYVEVRHRARRARPRCVCPAPPRPAPRPRPPAGERG